MATAATARAGLRTGTRGRARAAERRTSTGRRLHAVRTPARRRRLAPFLLLTTVVVAGLVLAVAVLQALVAQNSFRMEDLARRGATLREENGQLRLEAARLSSPRRIANEARRLGLRLPDPAEVKTLQVESLRPGNGSR